MSVDQHEEVDYDLNEPRISVYKNTWTIHQNTLNRCNLKVAQKKGLQFYQTRSNAIVRCVEQVVFMKSGKELHNKMNQSPTIQQRIVLKPNLHHGRQDTKSSDARTSFDHSSKHRENCDGQGHFEKPYSRRFCIMDVRIFPISKREHPPTIKANEAKSTERPEAKSSRRLGAVTSTSEYKVRHTQPFKKKTMFAEKQSRN